MKKKEEQILNALCERLRIAYPDVLYRVDLGGIRLTIGQAIKNKKIQKCRAWPDLFISEPAQHYHGLYIEVKKDRDEVFNKNGSFKKNRHIAEQAEILAALRRKGYAAEFGLGLDYCNRIIDLYFT